MHFEYEIRPDDFVASQLLCYKLRRGRKRVRDAVTWMVLGALLIFVALTEPRNDLAVPILPGILGVCFVYIGVVSLSPRGRIRRGYQRSELAGKRFKADMNVDGFEVTGEMNSWRVRWEGVRLKGEDERVFILSSAGTLFMFGKEYLNNEQQNELRRLSGLI